MTKEQIAYAIKTHANAKYDGCTYTVQECVLYVDKTKKELKYSAILLDRNGRTTVRVPIEQIELIDRKQQQSEQSLLYK